MKKKIIKEYFAGGNDWNDSYQQYQMNNRTNSELDYIVRELHTICQYFETIYQSIEQNQPLKPFQNCNLQQLNQAYNAMGDIYSLMMNRNNIKNNQYAMTFEEITEYCTNGLQILSDMPCLGVVCNAAKRALLLIKENSNS